MTLVLAENRPPIPPADLILRVACLFGEDKIDAARYAFDVEALEHLRYFERALAGVGRSFGDFERLLDFGCGCGRFLRHFGSIADHVEIHGTDIDAEMIRWVAANIPYVTALVGPTEPPLPYPAGYFDLIINHSVFTHLDERYQDLWLSELHRITRPGAIALLTVEGTGSWNRMCTDLERQGADTSEWRAELESRGILFIRDDLFIGSTHPDFYHSTFHAPWYVFQHWSQYFDVALYLPDGSISQDLVVLRRRDEPAPRSPAPAATPAQASTPPADRVRIAPPALRARVGHARRRLERRLPMIALATPGARRGVTPRSRRDRNPIVERRSLGEGGGSQWFWDHYKEAVDQIVEFCEPAGVQLQGRRIADIGSGDGIMAAGLCRRVMPASLVGFDIRLTNRDVLAARCHAEGVGALPPQLEFRESAETGVPAPDGAFDFIYSWSAFEHISQPVEVLTEIRRILHPDGQFFLQLWPFYRSAKGSHLWEWFDGDHHHLTEADEQVIANLRASDRHSPEWTEYMIREYETLNRLTVDGLQRALAAAGFKVALFELLTARAHVTPDLAGYSWTDLAVGGIKLLATPA
jgi:SAM-dependent methyltransferase